MELLNLLNKKQEQLFYHNMIDHFQLEDIAYRDRLQNTIHDIKWTLDMYKEFLEVLKNQIKDKDIKEAIEKDIANIQEGVSE